MAKTIVSVSVNYEDGTSAVMTQGEIRSPFAPGGKIILDAPKAASGAEVAANPGAFDGDPQDPTLAVGPTYWQSQAVAPAPPQHRLCDIYRMNPEFAREVWRHNLGRDVDESKFSPAQKRRCGLM